MRSKPPKSLHFPHFLETKPHIFPTLTKREVHFEQPLARPMKKGQARRRYVSIVRMLLHGSISSRVQGSARRICSSIGVRSVLLMEHIRQLAACAVKKRQARRRFVAIVCMLLHGSIGSRVQGSAKRV